VALHELGHSLGLGHSSDVNAIMYPWYQNNEVDGKLPDDDRHGIQELYGSKEKTWGPYRPRPTTTSTTTTTMRTMSYYPDKPVYRPNKERERARDRQEQERKRQAQERQEQEDRRRERTDENRSLKEGPNRVG